MSEANENGPEELKFVAAGQPNDNWTFDDLMKFGANCVSGFEGIEAQIACLAKKSAVQLFRAGRALVLAKKKRPKGKTWDKCIEECGIKGTSDWEARTLFEKAGTEDAIAGLGLTEAKVKFGIVKEKVKKEKVAKPSVKSNTKSKKAETDTASSDAEGDAMGVRLLKGSGSEESADNAGDTSEMNGETDATSDDEKSVAVSTDMATTVQRLSHIVNLLYGVKETLEDGTASNSKDLILAQVYEAENVLNDIREICGKEAAA